MQLLSGVRPSLAFLACVALGAHAQSQIQYSYDPAGNLVRVQRIGKPDLVVSSLSVSSIAQHSGGGYDIAASFTVTNAGNVAAVAPWSDRAYLSASATLHDTDQVLSGSNSQAANVPPGASYTLSLTFTTAPTTAAGQAYLIIKADGGTAASGQFAPTGPNSVDEIDETNNTRAVAITLPVQLPDLQVTTASLGAITVNKDGSYSIPATYTVLNTGGAAAQPSWTDMAYLSADATLDNADANLSGNFQRGTSLASNATYAGSATFTTTTTTAPGTYTLFLKTDGRGASNGSGTNTDAGRVAEAFEGNKAYAIPITLPAKPDLRVTSASVGTVSMQQNGTYNIPVTYTVTNVGGSTALASWTDLAFLSGDAVLDTTDPNLSGSWSQGTSLTAGASYTKTITFTATASTAPGNYTVFVKTDAHTTSGIFTNTDAGVVAEGDETNNTFALAVTLPARPDLQLSSASLGAISMRQDGTYNVPVTYTVTNAGGAAAAASWTDLAFISSDAVLDDSDVNLGGSVSQGTTLAPGASYTNTFTFTAAPSTAAGSYTIFIKADAHKTGGIFTNTDAGVVAEASEANNALGMSVTLPARPDLQLTSASLGAVSKNVDGTYNIPVTYTVTNIGASPAIASWTDLAFISSDAVLDNSDVNLGGTASHATTLASGASYTNTVTFTAAASTMPGSYTVFIKADAHKTGGIFANTDSGVLAESDETNNAYALAVTLP